MADIFPESREEEILVSMIDGEEYNKAPESRIEALLLELKEVIEEGGGGGGTTNYNLLQNKPSINSVTLTGDKSLEDLNIPTASDLAGKQDVLPVTASGNDVAFNGDIIDGQGNTLSVLAEALTKTASGNPVVITDCAGGKARSLKTTIEAIQDLHGYDHPWAGGAGKNKFNGQYSFQSSSIYSPVQPNTQYTISTKSTGVYQINIQYIYDDNTFGGDARLCAVGETSGSMTITTPSNAKGIEIYVANVNPQTQSEAYDTQIELGSTATSFAPYANICPISGRTAVAVDDLPNADYAPFFEGVKNGAYGFVDLGTLNWKYNSTNNFFWLDPDVLPNKQLGNLSCAIYNYVGAKTDTQMATVDNMSIALSSGNNIKVKNTSYTDATVFKTAMNGVYLIYELATPTTPSYTAEQWAALVNSFGGNNATIQLGQTVYGADINWDTGVMTIDHVKRILDGDAETNYGFHNFWESSTTWTKYMGRTQRNIGNALEESATSADVVISDTFASTSENGRNSKPSISASHTLEEALYIYFGEDSGLDTTAKQLAWLAQNPVEICYKLATPTTIQLTPTQLQMLKGYNRVTIESGTITLDYIAKAISGNDEEIAPLVGDKATKSYAVNDFIERNDGLYRVTASIASGASFTANNTVKMSIGEALTYLYNK